MVSVTAPANAVSRFAMPFFGRPGGSWATRTEGDAREGTGSRLMIAQVPDCVIQELSGNWQALRDKAGLIGQNAVFGATMIVTPRAKDKPICAAMNSSSIPLPRPSPAPCQSPHRRTRCRSTLCRAASLTKCQDCCRPTRAYCVDFTLEPGSGSSVQGACI